MKKVRKSDIERRVCSQESGFPHTTQILPCTFFCNLIFIPPWFLMKRCNIGASNKKSISKKEFSSVSEMTIQYLPKNILIRGGSRTAATSEMELFVIIVNGLWSTL